MQHSCNNNGLIQMWSMQALRRVFFSFSRFCSLLHYLQSDFFFASSNQWIPSCIFEGGFNFFAFLWIFLENFAQAFNCSKWHVKWIISVISPIVLSLDWVFGVEYDHFSTIIHSSWSTIVKKILEKKSHFGYSSVIMISV